MDAGRSGRFNGAVDGDEATAHERLADQATAFLREHAHEQVTVQDLADHLGYSPFHLTRLFTATVGASPVRYLAAWRFHRAKRLLLVDDAGVLEACHEVGFTSAGTFSRRFAAAVGVPPAALRRAADRVAERTAAPYALPVLRSAPHVLVRIDVPDVHRTGLGPDPLLSIGTFPTPTPTGPPVTGTLLRGTSEASLAVVPGARWLLATAVSGTADAVEHLAPARPLVGVHPVPLDARAAVGGSLGQVTVTLGPAPAWSHPLVVALAALRPPD